VVKHRWWQTVDIRIFFKYMEKLGFKAKIEQISEIQFKVTFEGIIDDSVTIPDLATAEIIEVDLEKLKYITSYGVSLWIEWLRRHPHCKKWILHKARPPVVAFYSRVGGFLPPGAVVESVFAPFISEDTFESKEELLQRDVHFNERGPMALPKPVDSTGKTMVPDFLPKRYFEFLGPQ
jgi:hypothetical protein